MDRTDATASRPPEPAEGSGVGGARAGWDELAARARALVQGLDPDVVPARQAVELWVACGEIARCFTGMQLLLARRVADAGVYKEAGARDTAEFLALRSGVSRASMSQMLATSQCLAELLAESVVKLVLTRHGEVTTVAHMGRSSPTPTQLAILHTDVTALAPTAAATGAARDATCCHIAGIGVIDRSTVRELLGQLDEVDVLERVLARGRDVANLTHSGRQPTVAQHTALLWAQPACSVQGCAHTFTQIDHRHDWHKQNLTELANLDRLCAHHHRLKTHQNYQLVPGTGDRPFVSPHDPRHPDNQSLDAQRDRAPPRVA